MVPVLILGRLITSHLLQEELDECLGGTCAVVGLSSVLARGLATGQKLDRGKASDLELLTEGPVGVSVGLSNRQMMCHRDWSLGPNLCLRDTTTGHINHVAQRQGKAQARALPWQSPRVQTAWDPWRQELPAFCTRESGSCSARTLHETVSD